MCSICDIELMNDPNAGPPMNIEELQKDLRRLGSDIAVARYNGDYEQVILLQMDAAAVRQQIEQLRRAALG